MSISVLERIIELCELIGIKTIRELQVLQDEYGIIEPTAEQLITALETEIGLHNI